MMEQCKEKVREMQHVFIVGSKSLGAYGGYTIVHRFAERKMTSGIWR